SNLDRLGNVPLHKSRSKRSIVAGLLVVVATGFSAHWYTELGDAITTEIGERRHVVLVDGTALDLNTDSKVRVKMEDGLRRVTLVRGEVLLNVAKDARPFEVHAADGILRDIGTTFNVRSDGETTNVAVLEGEVQIKLSSAAPIHLRGGQQVDYQAAAISAIETVNTADVTAWLSGRLIFRDTPLQEVVRQLNRYHSRPVELAGAGLGNLKVSGEFNSADRAGLLEALKMLLSLESGERLGSTELSARR
ncbi:MAG: FecR domain-containing protein, partial [Gammaproteobacteria bacterium]|nr:FecR domain-containing protein [Gammaproteobacteria bacterium]